MGTPMIQIDHGIPLPTFPRNTKYPWRELKIGDSFMVDISDTQKQGLHRCASKQGMKITYRKQSDGVRIWRVK
jgi:hypothetical protein